MSGWVVAPVVLAVFVAAGAVGYWLGSILVWWEGRRDR